MRKASPAVLAYPYASFSCHTAYLVKLISHNFRVKALETLFNFDEGQYFSNALFIMLHHRRARLIAFAEPVSS